MTGKQKYDPKIHHRKSIRLNGYDYSREGLYFITICTKDRECFFGNTEDSEMVLNDAGKMANEYWLKIPDHFPNVVLHEHIVMPNHIHGIIELLSVGVQNFEPRYISTTNRVQNFEPLHVKPLHDTTNVTKGQNVEPQHAFQKIIPRSVGSIIRGFKIGVTKWFRTDTRIHSVWQRNFHEHIIRNEQSYQTISNYIINNPAKWIEDKFYNEK